MYKHLIVFFLLITSITFSQVDFQNYSTLKSNGVIPEDFKDLTYNKIKRDLQKGKEELSKSDEKIFLENIHYNIDEILHSGSVVFGDEVSLYIKSIAENLLKNEPELKSKLRFYTIKSNETNAFSTDQGMIFITTGLISQLTSEAQLAYVLAHEISHFTENHIVETYKYIKLENDLKIKNLSIYSKNHEFEADAKGLQWYKNAGYNKDEIFAVFDVLMYSYLPFEEEEINISYFNTDNLKLNDQKLNLRKFPIVAEEDYDDSNSSHPNIKRRKDYIKIETQKLNDWGTDIYKFGESKFKYVRNICRFECVRTDVFNAKYAKSLYSIFILEKEFPNSIFLNEMKAQSFLGLVQYCVNNKISETYSDSTIIQGEISIVHQLISKLSHDEIITLGLRNIYDLKKKLPTNIQLNQIYYYLIKNLVNDSKFKLEDYTNYKSSKIDSVNIINLYSVNNDIFSDEDFNYKFKKIKEEVTQYQKNKSNKNKYTLKQLMEIEKGKTNLHCGIDTLILVEPMVYSYDENELNLIKSEKLKHDFSEVITSVATDAEVNISILDRDKIQSIGTDAFNERNCLINFMYQINENRINVFPVDFNEISRISQKYKTSKVMLLNVRHQFDPDVMYKIMRAILIYPALPIIAPIVLLNRNVTDINILILDINNGNVELETKYSFHDKPRKYNLGARTFEIFSELKIKN